MHIHKYFFNRIYIWINVMVAQTYVCIYICLIYNTSFMIDQQFLIICWLLIFRLNIKSIKMICYITYSSINIFNYSIYFYVYYKIFPKKNYLCFNKIDRYIYVSMFFICQINSTSLFIFVENIKLKFICYILAIQIYMYELY